MQKEKKTQERKAQEHMWRGRRKGGGGGGEEAINLNVFACSLYPSVEILNICKVKNLLVFI